MLESILELNAAFPWVFGIFFFVLGACIGSFLNVCIYRIPKKESVVRPRSHCMQCGKPIPWYDNLPILSWFMLRGKARCCGASFSPRYAMVEALTGALFLTCWLVLPPAQAIAGIAFVSFLVPATFIDLDTMELPDIFTVGGMIAGVVLSFALPGLHLEFSTGSGLLDALRSGLASLIGVFIGSGVILWVALLAETVLRKEAMGFGDVVFMGCIGAFCGWQGALFAIFGGAVLGTLFVIPLMLVQLLRGKPDPDTSEQPEATIVTSPRDDTTEEAPETPPRGTGFGMAIPFGPWLALGGLVYYLIARSWVDGYFEGLRELFYGIN